MRCGREAWRIVGLWVVCGVAAGCDDAGSADPEAGGDAAPPDAADSGGAGQAPDGGGPDTDLDGGSGGDVRDATPADSAVSEPDVGADPRTPDAGADPDPDPVDAGAAPPPARIHALPLSEAGLCAPDGRRDPPPAGPFTDVRDPSPFGSGTTRDVPLGTLAQPGAIVRAPNPGVVRYDLDMESETFDVYVPEAYDGSEPYGLVAFINSGDGGKLPGNWSAALDDARLIWIAGYDIGNPQGVDRRIGLTVLGAHRVLERFHIDRARVYASGGSGGGRSGMVTAMLHPDLFTGAFPLCGASWHRQVEQAYETREPDGHYEFWGAVFYPQVDGRPFGEWLRGFDRRFALMTSFDDFREGDLFNIYHFGLEAEGFDARLLEVPGGHCATNDGHVRDAIAFVEHPGFDGAGAGFADASADGASADAVGDAPISLVTDGDADALAIGRDRLHWGDRGGVVLRATIEPADVLSGTVTLAIADRRRDGDDVPAGALLDDPERAAVRVSVTATTLSVRTRGFGDGDWTLFEGQLEDWDGASPLPVKIHLWSEELRVESGAHLVEPVASPGVRLLDDRRSVRLRWAEAEGRTWPEPAWSADTGGHLAVKLASEAAETVAITGLRVEDAAGLRCGE